jgi:uncharacterized protein
LGQGYFENLPTFFDATLLFVGESRVGEHVVCVGRISKFYQSSFAALNSPVAVPKLLERTDTIAVQLHIKRDFALALLHAETRRVAGVTRGHPHTFFCDAGLGGLARWLRGAGYEAHWNASLGDAAAIREAQRLGATLLTTDSLMMERGVLRDGLVPAVFLPSSIACEEQFVVVLRELDLPLRESRCMKCGGELRRVDKSAVADRIPPKTAKWLDEYFICAQCDHLFWRGTHWQRITTRLRELSDFAPTLNYASLEKGKGTGA